MNIYIGWLIGAIIFGLFLTWGILIDKKIGKDEFYANYSTFLDLAKFFIPLSGLVLAYPFVYSNEANVTIIEWERIVGDLYCACVFEVVVLFVCFIPYFYRKTRYERSEAALREAFLKGAIKYGVNNNHFEPNRSYRVSKYSYNLEAPSYYMFYWSVKCTPDEVILIEEETKQTITMSEEHLWLKLRPVQYWQGETIFPWVINWEEGSFPKKEYIKWCKVRGI